MMQEDKDTEKGQDTDGQEDSQTEYAHAGMKTVAPASSDCQKLQNRKDALMYAANSFGSQEHGVDVDKVLEAAKKYETFLNGE